MQFKQLFFIKLLTLIAFTHVENLRVFNVKRTFYSNSFMSCYALMFILNYVFYTKKLFKSVTTLCLNLQLNAENSKYYLPFTLLCLLILLVKILEYAKRIAHKCNNIKALKTLKLSIYLKGYKVSSSNNNELNSKDNNNYNLNYFFFFKLSKVLSLFYIK